MIMMILALRDMIMNQRISLFLLLLFSPMILFVRMFQKFQVQIMKNTCQIRMRISKMRTTDCLKYCWLWRNKIWSSLRILEGSWKVKKKQKTKLPMEFKKKEKLDVYKLNFMSTIAFLEEDKKLSSEWHLILKKCKDL